MSALKNSESWADRRGPVAAICLPLLCASLVWLMGSRPQTLANVPELPALAFSQYMVDLREVAPTEEVFASFDFRNNSSHPVTITKLEPSCGCLQPQLRKKEFKPGEAGNFLLRVKTALQKPGFKEFMVTVHYTDPKPRTRDVFLRVTFPEQQIYLTPRAITFSPGSSAASTETEITMTDLRANSAEILGARCSLEGIQLKVLKPVTTNQGSRQQMVRLTLSGAVPSRRQVGQVTIYTNDGKFHELKVPIQILGASRQPTARQMGPQEWSSVRR